MSIPNAKNGPNFFSQICNFYLLYPVAMILNLDTIGVESGTGCRFKANGSKVSVGRR